MPVFKKVNKDFFKKWTPDMAYVLGFFSADGYLTLNKRNGKYWGIEVKDEGLVRKIKSIIESDHVISIRKRQKGKYTSYRLQIGSSEMYDDLYHLGMRTNKTKSLAVPNIPDKYLRDFVRGYFDGDGNVWVGLIHKDRKTQTFGIQTAFTSCSLVFLESLNEKLSAVGIPKGSLFETKSGYFRLVYSIKGSLKLYNFMYNACNSQDLVLLRKKIVFEKYMKMRL